MSELFKKYSRLGEAEARPLTTAEESGDIDSSISISKEDMEAGSPKAGDMVARNPDNHNDQWLIASTYFSKNFGPVVKDFGWAVAQMKAGNRVSREGWNGKGMWVVLMTGLKLPAFNTQESGPKVNDRTAQYIGEDTPLDSQPYIAMWTAAEQWQPGWLASQADILAEDWGVVC